MAGTFVRAVAPNATTIISIVADAVIRASAAATAVVIRVVSDGIIGAAATRTVPARAALVDSDVAHEAAIPAASAGDSRNNECGECDRAERGCPCVCCWFLHGETKSTAGACR